jgi:hypothetical protein
VQIARIGRIAEAENSPLSPQAILQRYPQRSATKAIARNAKIDTAKAGDEAKRKAVKVCGSSYEWMIKSKS